MSSSRWFGQRMACEMGIPGGQNWSWHKMAQAIPRSNHFGDRSSPHLRNIQIHNKAMLEMAYGMGFPRSLILDSVILQSQNHIVKWIAEICRIGCWKVHDSSTLISLTTEWFQHVCCNPCACKHSTRNNIRILQEKKELFVIIIFF